LPHAAHMHFPYNTTVPAKWHGKKGLTSRLLLKTLGWREPDFRRAASLPGVDTTSCPTDNNCARCAAFPWAVRAVTVMAQSPQCCETETASSLTCDSRG
jgi:hypothetical protein